MESVYGEGMMFVEEKLLFRWSSESREKVNDEIMKFSGLYILFVDVQLDISIEI